jgi:DNA-binding MarR family transcriptional regulator
LGLFGAPFKGVRLFRDKVGIRILTLLVVLLLISPGVMLISSVSGRSGVSVLTLGQYGQQNVPRSKNNDSEPNDHFTEASEITLSPTQMRVINGSVGIGDHWDFYKIEVDYGTKIYSSGNVTGSLNTDELVMFLDNMNIPNGVHMKLYDPDWHLLGISSTSTFTPPETSGNFTFIAQYKDFIYIQVLPNQASAGGLYQLTIFNNTKSSNLAFDDDNRFSTARVVNLTSSAIYYNEYLDYTHDNADFFTFDARQNQKIEVDLTIQSSNCDFDLYLFDNLTSVWLAASMRYGRGTSGAESIKYVSPDNLTYYVRVVVKIDGTYIGDRGDYRLTLKGNTPPYRDKTFQDSYIMDEDSDPITINLSNAFYDIDTGDQITIQIWNGISWMDMPGYAQFINVSANLKSNSITSEPELKITPNPDKFGTETIRLHATDQLAEIYTELEIYITIRPINDLPIINGTNSWIRGNNVNPSPDGTKITGFEGEQFETQVTAYDPVDPWDDLYFSDNTDLFEIHPITGLISFFPTYHVNGHHIVDITVRDNGTEPNETTKEFEFIIEGGTTYPTVSLLSPVDRLIHYKLTTEFTWEQTHQYFKDKSINYELYLSPSLEKVKNRDKSVLNATLTDITFFELKEPLQNKTTYYWTVIPNDGIHLGTCESGIWSFTIDVEVDIPRAKLILPYDKQMVDEESITLTWELDYSGTDPVKYDLYFEVSPEKILDRNATPYKSSLTAKSHEVKSLYPNKFYYWQVVPWTSKVRPVRNELDIWSFYITDEVPKVQLVSPVDRTVQYENWVTLSWDIKYQIPEDITYQLNYGISNDPASWQIINLTDTFEYTLTDLSDETYFWKVIPFLNTDLRGEESSTWSFTVYHSADMLHTKLISPVNITVYSQNIALYWETIYDDTIDVSTLWYDIYVDDSTNNPWEMDLLATTFRFNQYPMILQLEPKKTYYWYVIPHADTADSHVVGYCSSGVVSFEFDYAKPVFSFNLGFENSTITIEPGTSKTVYFRLQNTGNRLLNLDISYSSEANGNINYTLDIKKISLDLDQTQLLPLTILALPGATKQKYQVTVTASSREATNVTEQDTLEIIVDGSKVPNGSDNDKDSEADNLFTLAWIIIIIIILLLSMFIYTKIRRSRLLEHQRREQIFNYVKENPGQHFRGIQKALGFEVGVLGHHINKLEREEFIKSRQDGQYRRFYPMDAKIDVKLILSQVQENILNWIKKHPGISGHTIATQLGVDNKVVTYHVNVLQNAGFIYTEKQGREKLCYSAVGV